MDLTFQVPMQYCSLRHKTLLISPVTSTTGCFCCFGSMSLFFLRLFLHFYWPGEFMCGCPVLERLWGDTPHPRTREKLEQDCRRGKFTFRIKPHSYQRCSVCSDKPCVHQDPGTPETETELFECLLRRYRSAVDCHRGWGSGCSDLGMA